MSLIKIWIGNSAYDAEAVMVFRKLKKSVTQEFPNGGSKTTTHVMMLRPEYSDHPNVKRSAIFLGEEEAKHVFEKLKSLEKKDIDA